MSVLGTYGSVHTKLTMAEGGEEQSSDLSPGPPGLLVC